MKHIVIFRTSGSYINYATYNCQEVGLAKALTKKGYKVSVIMAGPKHKHIVFDYGNANISIYYLTYKALNQSICIFFRWKKILEQLRPDVLQVHEFGMLMSWKVAKWAKHKNVRCVLIQGNYETTQKPLLKQLEYIFNVTFGKSVINMVSAIGCKTKAAVKYLQRYGNVCCNLTPIGLDEDKFPIITTKHNIKEQYGLTGKKVLLYVGTLESRRNPLFLVKVLQNLSNNYILVIVGDGPQKKEIEKYIATNNINNVIMTGKLKQENLPGIYKAADIFLLASNYEIFGMVILEAMYFGCPVISTSTAGANTLINKNNGVILPVLDVEQWKSAIVNICENEKKLFTMKENCHSTIKEKYVWEKAVDKFIELYNFCN